jgi:hypothetical protein
MLTMGRREFITLLGGAAAAKPFTAQAQQPSRQVIGFLHLTSADDTKDYLPAFHQGLNETGYVEGKNVEIEYRWGQGRNDQLPSLIADLVQRQVSVIVTLESTLALLLLRRLLKRFRSFSCKVRTRSRSALSTASIVPVAISPASIFFGRSRREAIRTAPDIDT